MLKIGTLAPDFTLSTTPDSKLSLSDLRGKKVVLIFYPADWSPVCSDELTLINQAQPLLEKKNAIAVAVSVDSQWCHLEFAKSRKFHFPLLADFEPKGDISKLYESYDPEGGYSLRTIYLIDEEGIIRWTHLSPKSVNPGVDGILDALDELN